MDPSRSPASSFRCATCDYDLSGNAHRTSPHCPECGLELSESEIAIARERTLFRQLRRNVPAVVIVVAVLGTLAGIVFRDHLLFLVPILLLIIAPLGLFTLAAFADHRLGR